ncbi:MAG: beta-CASP ribonuclease aCPSF1 [Candidatus Micrarchaeota archaeon]|nr:beta-CASP ribonuclease aCPSF1 [Candidatus Micrarchaeota archaeon]
MLIDQIRDELKDLFGVNPKIKDYITGIYVYLDKYIQFDQNRLIDIIKRYKKRIYIRYLNRLDPETAETSIKNILSRYQIDDMVFSDTFGEVYIKMKHLNVLEVSNRYTDQIVLSTGWYPIFERSPSIDSGFTKSMFRNKYERDVERVLKKVGSKIAERVDSISYITVTMLGGFQEVGRTSMLFETKNSKFLIDAGIHPAPPTPQDELPMFYMLNSLNDIDGIIVSHAHADHVAAIPYLYKMGYDGPIYMTPPTLELSVLIQLDYLNLAERSENRDFLYSMRDIRTMIDHTVLLDYGQTTDVSKDVKLTFYNAGHVLGSASVHLNVADKFVFLYSGDIKYGQTQLFDPAHDKYPIANTVIIESTYGNRVLPSRAQAEQDLISKVREVIQRGGKVLIPAFAIGRSQEILLTLFSNADPDWNIPVYIDGMIKEASSLHSQYIEYLNSNIMSMILENRSPFEWEYLKTTNGKTKEEILKEPSIIIATAGMMNGGPVLEYLKLLSDDKNSCLIFVGYQSPGTLGSRIQSGSRKVVLRDGDDYREYDLQMEVVTIDGFSGHSDMNQLLEWLRAIRNPPRKVYTMHGEQSVTVDFAKTIKQLLKINADAPMNMERRRLK